MKKIVFIFTFFLILNNCGGFEFVYNTSDNVFLIKNVTNINVNGDDAYQIQTSLKDLIGHEENNPKYKLLVNSVKTEAADVITKDATASKFVIKYTINYELYNVFKNCKVFENDEQCRNYLQQRWEKHLRLKKIVFLEEDFVETKKNCKKTCLAAV